jgi:hypothetical protein
MPAEEPWTNESGRKALDAPDIWQALRLYLRACLLLGLGVAAMAVIAH